MSDPTDYQRKLAEAIFDDDMDSLAEVAPEVAETFRTSMRDEKIARIAAVLASEGVVDPEVYKYQQMQQHNTNVANEELSREVKRLKAEKESKDGS